MYSILDSKILYPITDEIADHDENVVSDLWNMDGHEVYRGSKDPQYTHANVYWLYDEGFQRVGCIEHNSKNHSDFNLLWYHDSEFGTLLQEDGWSVTDSSLWDHFPEHSYTRFINEGWATSPMTVMERCLESDFRIVTPRMLISMPEVYYCDVCGRRSFKQIHQSSFATIPFDFPNKKRVLFVDDDFVIHRPPLGSRVWLKLRLPDDDSLEQLRVLEQEPVLEQESLPPPLPLEPVLESPPQPTPQTEQLPQEQESLPPP